MCWWWLPCVCNPRVARVYCGDLLKYWARPRLQRVVCGSLPWLAMPLVFILVGALVEYPRIMQNWGISGGPHGCALHLGDEQRVTYTACDSKKACNDYNQTYDVSPNALCELACPEWDNPLKKSWQKCWGNCVENGFKSAFTDMHVRGVDVPIREQVTVKYIPYTVTFNVPTLAEAAEAGFGALKEMRPELAGLQVNMTGRFGQIVESKEHTFCEFEKGGNKDIRGDVTGETYKVGVDGGSRCFTKNYWWMDSGMDLDLDEFGISLGKFDDDYTSDYCTKSAGGYAPNFWPDTALHNILDLGRIDDLYWWKDTVNPAGKQSLFEGIECRISLAPLPDPATGKLPLSVQYPAPTHPFVYVLPRPFGGWFNAASQPLWPFRPYAVFSILFWVFFSLIWLPHLCLRVCAVQETPKDSRLDSKFLSYCLTKHLMRPCCDLIDFWLCLETPGIGSGLSVSQQWTPEWVCYLASAEECMNSDLCMLTPPCILCIPCLRRCLGDVDRSMCDHCTPTTRARLDYGHDYWRNRAADTFTNVPQPQYCGGTGVDYPHQNIRAILLVGPQLIGKRTILAFAKARGFETCNLAEEIEAQSATARWEHALVMFQALRDDPERAGTAPVLFGAGGTPWEHHAMPADEVERMSKLEGVEVVSLLWADAGEHYDREYILTSKDEYNGGASIATEMFIPAKNWLDLMRRQNAPAALNMDRWSERVEHEMETLGITGAQHALRALTENATKYARSTRNGNPWDRAVGRRIVVDMHPEEALVRILMPYRWRKGKSILWGGCTKGAPSLTEVSEAGRARGAVFREFPELDAIEAPVPDAAPDTTTLVQPPSGAGTANAKVDVSYPSPVDSLAVALTSPTGVVVEMSEQRGEGKRHGGSF